MEAKLDSFWRSPRLDEEFEKHLREMTKQNGQLEVSFETRIVDGKLAVTRYQVRMLEDA